jgi:integrase
MIYKRPKKAKRSWYWMDDTINGVRYREPLRTQIWQEALQKHRDRLLEIQQGKAGSKGPIAKQTFEAAADAYIDERELHSAEMTYRTDRDRSQPLRKFFGELPLKKITPKLVVDYQKARKETGVSGRTINLEVGLLRRILKKNKQWARIAEDVFMLPERPKEARILAPDEKKALLEMAAVKDEWRVARCAAMLALNTTMRSCEIRGLRWKDIDGAGKTLTIRRESTKTNAGARVIPLNADALAALMDLWARAEELNSNKPEHYVVPSCERGNFDATEPMKNWRTAWRKLTRAITCPNCNIIQQPQDVCKNEDCRAGIKDLKSPLHGLRFHDLRHQAVTELAELGLSDQTIMSIAGHVSRQMLDHYSHIRMDAKRKALEALKAASSRIVTSQFTSQNEKPAEARLEVADSKWDQQGSNL